ncbi:MAG: acetyl-CoA carboxylase biotin carboxyl carrier protein subunit, partial [Microthrixaceae bacterium]|nr:acetyl-CoA carboxylase biotin carboxyl carrier protein subunit [Microthrixaceae bacterium]
MTDDEPHAVTSPLQGRVVEVRVATGDPVAPGAVLAVIESMKMHHDVVAPIAGIVDRVATRPDAQVS